MRTTLDLDDRLLREARKRAVDTGQSLARIVERALRAYFDGPRSKAKAFRLDLLVKNGRARPRVDWDDRNSLYERMDGRS